MSLQGQKNLDHGSSNSWLVLFLWILLSDQTQHLSCVNCFSSVGMRPYFLYLSRPEFIFEVGTVTCLQNAILWLSVSKNTIWAFLLDKYAEAETGSPSHTSQLSIISLRLTKLENFVTCLLYKNCRPVRSTDLQSEQRVERSHRFQRTTKALVAKSLLEFP